MHRDMLTQQLEVGCMGIVQFLWCTCIISERAQPPLGLFFLLLFCFCLFFWGEHSHFSCTYIYRGAFLKRTPLGPKEYPHQKCIFFGEKIVRGKALLHIQLGTLQMCPYWRWRGVLYEGFHYIDTHIQYWRVVLDDKHTLILSIQYRRGVLYDRYAYVLIYSLYMQERCPL